MKNTDQTGYAGRSGSELTISLSLVVRNLLFTFVVPGLGAVWMPWRILTLNGATPKPVSWFAIGVIAVGTALYLLCLWVFAAVGRGTPGPWDAPRRFVAVGPYRWVRNPIYIAALLVVLGESWLFHSLPLLKYAVGMAICFHLFVIGYEEPTLHRKFGDTYLEYKQVVSRWVPGLKLEWQYRGNPNSKPTIAWQVRAWFKLFRQSRLVNAEEARTYQEWQRKGAPRIAGVGLCPILFHLPWGLLNVMPRAAGVPPDRINLSKDPFSNGAVSTEEMRAAAHLMGRDSDTHKPDTFGLINGELMVVDYGWLHPRYADKIA